MFILLYCNKEEEKRKKKKKEKEKKEKKEEKKRERERESERERERESERERAGRWGSCLDFWGWFDLGLVWWNDAYGRFLLGGGGGGYLLRRLKYDEGWIGLGWILLRSRKVFGGRGVGGKGRCVVG